MTEWGARGLAPISMSIHTDRQHSLGTSTHQYPHRKWHSRVRARSTDRGPEKRRLGAPYIILLHRAGEHKPVIFFKAYSQKQISANINGYMNSVAAIVPAGIWYTLYTLMSLMATDPFVAKAAFALLGRLSIQFWRICVNLCTFVRY